jgi:hypothetical protein
MNWRLMLTRPPARHGKRSASERELHRLAEARRRARERKHVKLYQIRAGELVFEALKARNLDAKMTPEAAESATRNRAKVKRDLENIVLQWAKHYLAERQT